MSVINCLVCSTMIYLHFYLNASLVDDVTVHYSRGIHEIIMPFREIKTTLNGNTFIYTTDVIV